MNMTITLLALILLLAALVLVFRSKKESSTESKVAKPSTSSKSTEYHSVSIKTTATACKAAKDLDGKRFLSAESPVLPLPDCDVADCNCRFEHHADRRRPQDRRSPFAGSISETGVHRQEQRESRRDRRDDGHDDLL